MQIIEIITILTNFKTNSKTADSFKHTFHSAEGSIVCRLPCEFGLIVQDPTQPVQAVDMVYLLMQCPPINGIYWHLRPASRKRINM